MNIGDHHEAKDNQSWYDYAGDPGIEVNEHFLQAEEIPRSFGGVHGEVGVGGFFERRVQGDGPDHEDDGDYDGGEEFDAQKKRPDVNFSGPAGLERPGLAVVRLG